MDAEARIAELHRRLVEETDDAARARMHLELGAIAARAARLDAATRHFREALAFEPGLIAARTGLAQLGVRQEGERKRDVLRRAWGRWAGASRA
jgi:hypothetical protein